METTLHIETNLCIETTQTLPKFRCPTNSRDVIQKNVNIHPYPNNNENGINKTEFTVNVTTMNVTTQLITKKEMEVPDSKLSFIYVFINLCLACDKR